MKPRHATVMDWMLSSKWVLYVVIALAVAYLWVHFEGTFNLNLFG